MRVFFSSRRRHTRFDCDWSSDVCSSDLALRTPALELGILPGIGRGRLLELARGAEGRHGRSALEGKSLLLVNAVRGVVPIASLDGQAVSGDPRTGRLAVRFLPAG